MSVIWRRDRVYGVMLEEARERGGSTVTEKFSSVTCNLPTSHLGPVTALAPK